MLISENYRQLNQQKHESSIAYGTSGQCYANIAQALMDDLCTTSLLDYGCGKRTLETALGISISNYDPCLPGLDKSPSPHDIVICTDVLEHIEPECLTDVLHDLRRVTKKAGFLLVDTEPANKHLADGRNAHLIQEDFLWWKERIEAAGFTIRHTQEFDRKFAVYVK